MDQLVGHVWAVVLGRVNMVDTQIDHPAEHRQSSGPVARRAKHPRPGQLHGPEADAAYGATSKFTGAAGAVEFLFARGNLVGHVIHPCPAPRASGLVPHVFWAGLLRVFACSWGSSSRSIWLGCSAPVVEAYGPEVGHNCDADAPRDGGDGVVTNGGACEQPAHGVGDRCEGLVLGELA